MPQLYYKNNEIFKIVISALCLAFSILFVFLSEYFVFLSTFLKFNFSLIFIILCFLFTDIKYSIIVIVARFIISPLFSKYGLISILGESVSMTLAIIFVFFLYLFIKSFNKILKNKYYILLISLSLSALVSIISIIILNTLFFNVAYFYVYGFIKNFSLVELIEKWDNFKFLFFGINDYVLANIALYGIFNLIFLSSTVAFVFIISAVFFNKISIVKSKIGK